MVYESIVSMPAARWLHYVNKNVSQSFLFCHRAYFQLYFDVSEKFCIQIAPPTRWNMFIECAGTHVLNTMGIYSYFMQTFIVFIVYQFLKKKIRCLLISWLECFCGKLLSVFTRSIGRGNKQCIWPSNSTVIEPNIAKNINLVIIYIVIAVIKISILI